MPATVQCPSCGKGCGIPDSFKGGSVRCPSCRQPFTIPAAQPIQTPAQAPLVAMPFPSDIAPASKAMVPWLWIAATFGLTTCLVAPCGVGVGWFAGGRAPSGQIGAGKVVDAAGNTNKKEQPDSAVNATAFDPKDLKNTRLWIDATWRPVEQAKKVGNDLVEAEAKAKANKELATIKGRAVEWIVGLAQIRTYDRPGQPGTDNRLYLQVQHGIILGPFGRNNKQNATEFMIPWVDFALTSERCYFAAPNDNWVRTAKNGDSIRLTGNVAALCHRLETPMSDDPRDMIFLLADAKISPAKK